MSGYIHTIEFKVLIDSEVIDFTFRVPRGTLLIQVLDELETTLKIEPNIIAAINSKGEIDIIENHYSAIDYLVQKHGHEFFVGESSIVTFNHREYIVDLEIPEAIPFASTFRTACKSFSVRTQNVAIERQDGQVMDYEVFSMPTAFVLNSWGNFYRIVDRELGDPLIDPPSAETMAKLEGKTTSTVQREEDKMIYPPSLDETQVSTTASSDEQIVERSEIDQITDHYVETTDQAQETASPFKEYPWESKKAEEPTQPSFVEEPQTDVELPQETTIESLLEDIDVISEEEEDLEDIEEDSFLTRPIPEEPSKEDTIITDVDMLTDEETPAEQRISDILEFTEEEEIREELTPQEEDEFDYFAQDYEEEQEEEFEEPTESDYEEDYEKSISDLPEVDETLIPVESRYPKIDAEPPYPEEFAPELGEESLEEVEALETPTEFIDMSVEAEELAVEDQPILTSPLDESIPLEEKIPLEEETIEEDIWEEEEEVLEEKAEEEEELVKLESLTDDIIIKTEEEIPTELDETVIEETIAPITEQEVMPLEERLEKRKQELKSLEVALKEEEKKKVQKRSLHVEYYEKMNPRKIFPLIVEVPAVENNGNNEGEIKIVPVFPGCYITPHMETIDLKNEQTEQAEFNITPLINNGTVQGRVGIWFKNRLLLNVNTRSKIRNYVGSMITGIIAFIFGLLPFILRLFSIDINTALANGLNSTFGTSLSGTLFMWIELGLLIILLGLMIGFIFIGRPTKNKIKRQFYPIPSEKNE